jgi:hypothetical protein
MVESARFPAIRCLAQYRLSRDTPIPMTTLPLFMRPNVTGLDHTIGTVKGRSALTTLCRVALELVHPRASTQSVPAVLVVSQTLEEYAMKVNLRTMLIALASVQIALAATGSVAAIGAPTEPIPSTSGSPSPSPSASQSPSPSATPSMAETTASPIASAISDLAAAPARTNLTAVFDPIAVPARDGQWEGFRVRVGVRNSGPRSISAPAGSPAVQFRLTLFWTGPSRSLDSGCEHAYETFPTPEEPPRPAYYVCRSGPTLRAGETYWRSFFFSNAYGSTSRSELVVSGYAEDTNHSDDKRMVVVRLAEPGSGLPVTGARPIGVAGIGLTLIVAGVIAIWYGRRRRLTQHADYGPPAGDERAS